MESLQRKQSLKTSKLSIQHLSCASPPPLSNHKTSIYSPSPRHPKVISQKRQYERMKLLFRNSTTQYYSNQIKFILQGQVSKIKQSQKVKAMIETLKTCDNKQMLREKHHKKVALVSEQVKQKDIQKSISNLEGYLKKKEQTDIRVQKFIKQKRQHYLNRSILSHRSHPKQQLQQHSSSSVNYIDVSMTERKKSVIHPRISTANDEERKQKLRIKRQEQQDMKITSFMVRMKGIQQSLARKQISKHQKINQMKKIPVKCLTKKRNQHNESLRQGWQKSYDVKNSKAESYLKSKQTQSDFNNFQKSLRSLEHSRIVCDRRQEINRNFVELKASKSHMNFSSILQKRHQHQNILQIKRQFKLKKQYQKENNQKLMKKLTDKITDLKLIDSKQKLPQDEINNFDRLLKQLNGKNMSTDIFKDTKYSVANRMVVEEQNKNKTKKLNKKNH